MRTYKEIKKWVVLNRRISYNSIEECYQERDNERQANIYKGQVQILTNLLEWLDEETSDLGIS